MNFNDILNTVLNTAKQSAENINKPSENTSDKITKIGGGVALAGLLSMVFGRSGGASLTKLGSLAVLGNLAYKAYQSYQQKQTSDNATPTANVEQLTETDFDTDSHNEAKSNIILRAMIAAALSDGVLDESEQALIEREDNNESQEWIINEIQHPISIEEIARIVGNDIALASQVYLAARMACQDLSRKEIVFLAQLAEALNLDDALVERLEKQIEQ